MTRLTSLVVLTLCLHSIQGFSHSNNNKSSRRQAIQQFLLIGSTAAIPGIANAEYGTDAKMLFPDVVQGLNDRATKQCLVESLGNRECLVYREDAEKLLYKGADVSILIQRIQASTTALDKIPSLVETKQWNAITGILTGPKGWHRTRQFPKIRHSQSSKICFPWAQQLLINKEIQS
jgi:hypothetical protein